MPWCPKCGTEYREGFKTCSDCNSDLVDKPEHLENKAEPQFDKEAFLVSVGNSMEADMLEALLNSNSIPVLKKYREAGDYLRIYMGGTNFGVDLYVPSQLLSKAQEIIENNQVTFEDGELQGEDAELQGEDAELQGDEQQQVDDDAQQDEKIPGIENETSTGTDESYSKKRRIFTWMIILIFIPGIIWMIFLLISQLFKSIFR